MRGGFRRPVAPSFPDVSPDDGTATAPPAPPWPLQPDLVWKPHDLRELRTKCLALKADLFERGGATIETPPPSSAGDALVARTVIQPDGDLLCIIAEDAYVGDGALREQHTAAVRAWIDGFTATTTTAAALLRRLIVAVALAAGTLIAIAAGRAWGLLIGLGMAAAVLVARAAERTIGWATGALRRSRDASVGAAGRVRVAIVTAAAAAAAFVTLRAGGVADLAFVAALPLLGLLVGWAAQAFVRRRLGLQLR